MKSLLNLEYMGITALSVYVLLNINPSLFLLAFSFFIPDLFAVGYLVNSKVGSFTYNLAHHQGTAALLVITGHLLGITPVLYAGIVIFAHSSFDSILGYGLKYPDGFRSTHLG